MKKYSELKAPKMKSMDEENELMSELGLDSVEDIEMEEDMADEALDMEKPELSEILAGFSKEEIQSYLDTMEDEDMDMGEEEDSDEELEEDEDLGL